MKTFGGEFGAKKRRLRTVRDVVCVYTADEAVYSEDGEEERWE